MLKRLTIWAGLLALLVPAGATAAPVPHRVAATVVGGPVLTPGGAVWAQAPEVPDTGPLRVVRLTGRSERTVYQNDLGAHGRVSDLQAPGIALVDNHLLLALRRLNPSAASENEAQRAELLTGPLSGPFTTVAGTTSTARHVAGLDSSGELVVTSLTTAAGSPVAVELRDMAMGAPPRQVGPNGAARGRVAGAFVSWIVPDTSGSAATIVVADVATGAERYRVSVPLAVYEFTYDLQDDGTVVVEGNANDTKPAVLSWASPADPALHPFATGGEVVDLSPRDAFMPILRVADGQAFYATDDGTLALAPIAGGTPRALTTAPPGALLGADFDGKRLVYATDECVYTDTVTNAKPVAAPFGTCRTIRLGLETNPSAANRNDVPVAISCGDVRCSGTLVLRTPRDDHPPVIVAAKVRFHIAANRTAHLHIGISAALQRRLYASLGRDRSFLNFVPLDADVTVRDPGGLTARAATFAGNINVRPKR